jgi:hypothetical protein
MKDHLILFFVLLAGKLYLIGMLYTLNSRVMLRERMRSHDFGRTSLGTWQWEQETRTTRTFGSGSEVKNSVSHVSRAQSQFISPLNCLMLLQPRILPARGLAIEVHQVIQTSHPMIPATAFRLLQHESERHRISCVWMCKRLVLPCADLLNRLALKSQLTLGKPSQILKQDLIYAHGIVKRKGT